MGQQTTMSVGVRQRDLPFLWCIYTSERLQNSPFYFGNVMVLCPHQHLPAQQSKKEFVFTVYLILLYFRRWLTYSAYILMFLCDKIRSRYFWRFWNLSGRRNVQLEKEVHLSPSSEFLCFEFLSFPFFQRLPRLGCHVPVRKESVTWTSNVTQ